MLTITLLDKQGYRKFGFIMALFIALIFGLFLPWMAGNRMMPVWPWIVAAGFILWSLIYPMGLKHLYRPWMWVGHYLGLANTSIVLALVFYTVLSPIGLFLKLTGKDPMDRKWKSGRTETYWVSSNKQPENSVENIF